MPRALRRLVLGGLLLVKVLLLATFIVFLAQVRTFKDDAFIVLAGIYVVARTLLMGFVLGWFAHP